MNILTEISNDFLSDKDKFSAMKARLLKQGGLLYQYRGCRDDGTTIYDINNIMNQVLFARTPLCMNDPFDSMIGYSTEQICEEAVWLAMEKAQTPINIRPLIALLIKNQMLSTTAKFIDDLNDIKTKFIIRQKSVHQTHTNFKTFVSQNIKQVYTQYYKKSKYDYSIFCLLASIICEIDIPVISEKDLMTFINMDEHIALLKSQIEETKEIYKKAFATFLSKINISCFSSSGWSNTLMWAHYANSYAGICIEYDLTRMDSFVGFIYPVEYSKKRPTLSLKDVGINNKLLGIEESKTMTNEQIANIMAYLLVKDTCWNYEDEWRFLDIGDKEQTCQSVYFPYIKSITFGSKINTTHKDLLIDVCKSQKIDCYDLILSSEDFSMTREKIDIDNYQYDASAGIKYINFLSDKIQPVFDRITVDCGKYEEYLKAKHFDGELFENIMVKINEAICLMSFVKKANNLYSKLDDFKLDEETQNNLLEFEEHIKSFFDNLSDLEENIKFFYEHGFIKYKQHTSIKQKLNILKDVIPKYLSSDWNFV